MEEVLKRKFPDVSPPKTSSTKSHSTSKTSNNTYVPNLTTSETIKQEVKEEPGGLNNVLYFLISKSLVLNMMHQYSFYQFFKLGLTSRKENDKITNTTHSNNLNSSQQTSSPSLPQPANIPNKIKTEETNGSKKPSNTTKENDSIKMDIISSSPAASSLLNNLKKNQSILDIKMDAAKLHHQHIMLNMLRTTPITAKNFYKVFIEYTRN